MGPKLYGVVSLRGLKNLFIFLAPLSASLRFRLASAFAFSVVVCLFVRLYPHHENIYVPAFRIFSNLVCEFVMIPIA